MCYCVLSLLLQGNDNVVYNGSFYYYTHEIESIVRFDLATRSPTKIKIPRNRFNKGSKGKLVSPLYKSGQPGNYVDLAVDENGLWALFGLDSENNTIILKMEPFSLELQWAWNISLNPFQASHLQIGD